MLLQCAGMIRSGSTLQYNISKRIVELTETGEHIHANEDIWLRCRLAFTLADRWLVNKSHVYQPTLFTRETIGRTKIVMVYRDLRDVLVSQMRFRGSGFDDTLTKLRAHTVDRERRWLDEIPAERVLRVCYETMYPRIAAHAMQVAAHMDIDLSVDQAEQIAADLDKEKVGEKSKRLHNMDAHTRLGRNHVQNGAHGWYRQVLTGEQVAIVEDEVGDWLLENGYEIS